MRFFADGPNIPDELLEARDRGNVVFLCGAGVSIPAGMPTFLDLAKEVVDELGASPNSTLRHLLSFWDRDDIPDAARPPLDQIFNLLQLDYEVSEIEYLIAKRLRTKRRTDVSTHETILRLSKSVDGRPQIVTTNFDLLFQYADRRLAHYVPPNLPNLAYGQGLNGLVYLHGRINNRIRKGEAPQGLVVSSSDFGQAYLAEGWATRFILDLLKRYTVVLLGYSANDPPVRYLLQGLRKTSLMQGATIYAFDGGAEEEVRANWRDSIVRVLAYPETDGHSALWDTLEAWADRADDPSTWRRGIVKLAQRGPRNLEMHERGQVASLVKTIDGAKLFAETDPPPPGEWLCVFDSTIRCGKVERNNSRVSRQSGPLIEYGLDDDPHRPGGSESEKNLPGDHLLSLRSTDPYKGYVDLAEMPSQELIALPDRLAQLVRWIAKVSHEPVVPWWAAKHTRLHPLLLHWVELRLRQNSADFPPLAKSMWRLLFEKFQNVPDDDSPGSLFKVKQLIRAEGWTRGVLRVFERSASPFLENETRPVSRLGRPPHSDWPALKPTDIAELRIGFPRVIDIGSDVPDEVLPKVYRIGRRQLEVAVEVLGGVSPDFKTALRLNLNNRVGASSGNHPVVYLHWFRKLLDKMARTRPDLVRTDLALWPEEDLYFFHGLRLYAWSFDSLFTGDEIAIGILSWSHEAFWDDFYRREFLHLLRKRWPEIPQEGLRLLEKRIIQGPLRRTDEPEELYVERRSLVSATILGWLIIHGCNLSEETHSILPTLRAGSPLWHPDLDKRADEPYGEVSGGWINSDEDPSALINAPVSEIIGLARANTSRSFENLTDYLPFAGLVKQCPRKAMASLTREARKGDYPVEFWSPLLQEWPEDARPQLTWLLGARIARLPTEIMVELRFFVFSWVENNFPRLAMMDQARAWTILDGLLDRLFSGGDDATRSNISGVRVAGDSQGWSRRTIKHAENGPAGKVAWLLIDLLKSWNTERGSGMPSEVRVRLERLVNAPGEGADHAVCVIADRFEWLLHLDPEWTRHFIIPWFDPDHPWSEPAWNGLLRRHRCATPELLSLLKTHFLGVFSRAKAWKWNDDGLRVLHEFLVQGCLRSGEDEAYLTYPEVRLALQTTDDSGRVQCIEYLYDCIERNHVSWHDFGRPFLEEAWPKESRFQSEDAAITLSQIAEVSGDHFPEAVQTILPRLVPIYGDRGFLYRAVSGGGTEEFELATRFPKATLALVNKLVPNNPPGRLSNLDLILDKIAEAKPTLRQDRRWRRLKKIARLE